MSQLSHMQTYSNRNNLDHRTMAGSSEILHSHSELRSVAPDVVQGSNESLQKKKSTRKLASSLRTADTLASSSRINVRAKIGAKRTSGQPQNDESDSEQQSVFSKGIVVYFRLKVKSSSSKRSVIKEILRANHPNALILLEAAPENPRSTYSSRTMLNRLMNDVFDEKVREIIIADFNHICSTKDGFLLFCWICDRFGTKVLISPALQLV